ncbi:hypothetical protein AHAS_Ahas19G0134300 [Arachis hypogaea]
MQETRAAIRNLEVQMGQLATKVTEIDQRSTNTFPSNIIPNPREECKVITLVSGPMASKEVQVTEELIEKEALEKAQAKEKDTPERHLDNPFPVDLEQYPVKPKAPEYKQKMPYPQRLQKETKDK